MAPNLHDVTGMGQAIASHDKDEPANVSTQKDCGVTVHVVVDVEAVRNEYHRIEDRLYRLRCNFGYTSVRNGAFKKLEQKAQRLNRLVRQMETTWGTTGTNRSSS